MDVCPICEASLTLNIGKLVPAYTCITYIPVSRIAPETKTNKNKQKSVTAPIMKPIDDQKPETFWPEKLSMVGSERVEVYFAVDHFYKI